MSFFNSYENKELTFYVVELESRLNFLRKRYNRFDSRKSGLTEDDWGNHLRTGDEIEDLSKYIDKLNKLRNND